MNGYLGSIRRKVISRKGAFCEQGGDKIELERGRLMKEIEIP
jgi:hypothetical protein